MEKSESIDQLATALSKFQGELNQPSLNSTVEVKTRTGGSYKFKYADLSECKKAANKPLSNNGLSVAQLIEDDYSICTMLLHASGQWISSRVKIPATEQGAQAIGSAITYAKRYAFCAILGIVADDDEDGNLSQGNTANKKNSTPSKPELKMFDLKLVDNQEFMQKIYSYEKKDLEESKRFSLKAFIETFYRIDSNAFDLLVNKYIEFKTNNSL